MAVGLRLALGCWPLCQLRNGYEIKPWKAVRGCRHGVRARPSFVGGLGQTGGRVAGGGGRPRAGAVASPACCACSLLGPSLGCKPCSMWCGRCRCSALPATPALGAFAAGKVKRLLASFVRNPAANGLRAGDRWQLPEPVTQKTTRDWQI